MFGRSLTWKKPGSKWRGFTLLNDEDKTSLHRLGQGHIKFDGLLTWVIKNKAHEVKSSVNQEKLDLNGY